jgi:hypothetical protein
LKKKELAMNPKNVEANALRPIAAKAVLVVIFALNGVMALRNVTADQRLLTTEWILLDRLWLAALCGWLLFGAAGDETQRPSKRSVLMHSAAAAAILLPSALCAAPALRQSATGLLCITAICAMLGANVAMLYSLACRFFLRSSSSGSRTWLRTALATTLYASLGILSEVCVGRRLEGPALLLRPVAQALVRVQSTSAVVFALASMTALLLVTFRLVRSPAV